jgi:hypothetical protein
MNILKGFGIALQIPAWIILGGSVIAGFYAYANNIANITLKVPVILLAIAIAYVLGRIFVNIRTEASEEPFETKIPSYDFSKVKTNEGNDYDKYN